MIPTKIPKSLWIICSDDVKNQLENFGIKFGDKTKNGSGIYHHCSGADSHNIEILNARFGDDVFYGPEEIIF